jgi:hypothetical protein
MIELQVTIRFNANKCDSSCEFNDNDPSIPFCTLFNEPLQFPEMEETPERCDSCADLGCNRL